MKINILIILLLMVAISCTGDKKEEVKQTTEQQIDSALPCDDVDAPKVKITEEGINLLEESDEGCKLEE